MTDLCDLFSHNVMTNDNIISFFLEIFCSHFNYSFLCLQTLPLLNRDGWSHITRFFAANRRNRQRSIHCPHKTGEAALSIPCFINNNHWVALVRREIHNRVLFLYSDELNCVTILDPYVATLSGRIEGKAMNVLLACKARINEMMTFL
jgi:hypothetical protein